MEFLYTFIKVLKSIKKKNFHRSYIEVFYFDTKLENKLRESTHTNEL